MDRLGGSRRRRTRPAGDVWARAADVALRVGKGGRRSKMAPQALEIARNGLGNGDPLARLPFAAPRRFGRETEAAFGGEANERAADIGAVSSPLFEGVT
jgi:hypothetical protein